MLQRDGGGGVVDRDGIHDLCLLLGIKWLPRIAR